MNIIELVRHILTDYPKITEFTNEINIDFTDDTPTNFGLSSGGDNLVKEDILGIKLDNTTLYCMLLISLIQIMTDWQTVLFYWI